DGQIIIDDHDTATAAVDSCHGLRYLLDKLRHAKHIPSSGISRCIQNKKISHPLAMTILASNFASDAKRVFPFRPWTRRAGVSILIIAAFVTLAIIVAFAASPSWRFGWIREPFVWVYIGTLWLGGAKVFAGTLRPVA